MFTKVRNRKHENGIIKVPFSVYLNFLKPATVKGREVIFFECSNNGNITAHEGGMRGRFLPTMSLDPHGMLAMQGQRYPITDFGFENLVVKLIEKGERDRQEVRDSQSRRDILQNRRFFDGDLDRLFEFEGECRGSRQGR